MKDKNIGTLAVKLKTDTMAFKKGLSDAHKSVDNFSAKASRSFSKMAGLMKGAAVPAAIAGIGAAAVGAGRDVAMFAGEIALQSKALNLSTQKYQEYAGAAAMAGMNVEQFTDAFNDFNIRVGEAIHGEGELADAFDKMGLSVTDNQGLIKTNTKLFEEMADKLSTMEDKTLAATYADQIFSDNGRMMLSVLQDGKKGLDDAAQAAHEYGMVLSDDVIANAEEMRQKMGLVDRALEVQSMNIKSSALPIYAEWLNVKLALIQAAVELARSLGMVGEYAGRSVKSLKEEYAQLGETIEQRVMSPSNRLSANTEIRVKAWREGTEKTRLAYKNLGVEIEKREQQAKKFELSNKSYQLNSSSSKWNKDNNKGAGSTPKTGSKSTSKEKEYITLLQKYNSEIIERRKRILEAKDAYAGLHAQMEAGTITAEEAKAPLKAITDLLHGTEKTMFESLNDEILQHRKDVIEAKDAHVKLESAIKNGSITAAEAKAPLQDLKDIINQNVETTFIDKLIQDADEAINKARDLEDQFWEFQDRIQNSSGHDLAVNMKVHDENVDMLNLSDKEPDDLSRTQKLIQGISHDLKDIEGMGISVTEQIAGAFGDMAANGELSMDNLGDAFESMSKRMISQMIQMGTEALMLQGLQALFPNVFPTTATIPGRATGGRVIANQPYMVGERGKPELFIPDVSGTIDAHPKTGGNSGSTSINSEVNVVNNSSQPVTAESNTRFDGEKMVTDIILKDLQKNGSISNALKRK